MTRVGKLYIEIYLETKIYLIKLILTNRGGSRITVQWSRDKKWAKINYERNLKKM